MEGKRPPKKKLKKEESDVKPSLAERLLKICADSRKTAAELEKALGIKVDVLLKTINSLLGKGKLEVFKTQDGSPSFQCTKASSKISNLHGMGTEERLVYQLIEESGNQGIWTRDLRFKSRLDQKELSRVLKGMESRKIIKSVKTVVAAKKKIWMLYNVTPSRNLTGGAWYSDQDFEAEFIGVLCKLCTKFLENRYELAAKKHPKDPIMRLKQSYASVADITAYITSTKISKVELKDSDVVNILDTLVFDNAIESCFLAERGEQAYKISRVPKPTVSLTSFPCGACPVFNNCGENGEVSPKTCVYMQQWLNF